ncbi:MAG: NADH-quinone oxidoreductase subunit N, partial [Actinomycetota bacterium]|nr:NADH-quinone oxidoreductase subunit N [Actinomycetota bacterium]
SMYVLAAYHRRREQSGEAGLKYFLLGAFSSAIFLYGVALTYGATGSLQYDQIAGYLASTTLVHDGVLLAGMFLVVVGLGFKVSAVPFHFWTPDVYQGSPTPFTGYMAAVAKAAAFAGLIRYLDEALPTQAANWRPAIWLIAVLTLLVGSVLAIAQRDLKRMFAYSSISQAGYVLIGVQAASSRGASAAEFYLFTYVFIIAGSFAVIAVIQGAGEARNDLGALRGLGRRRPLLAAVLLVFLLAQAGVPLTSGFLGKFYVIESAVAVGQWPLAIIGMLAAAIAAFFYLRVALVMYLDPEVAGTAGGGDASSEGGDVAAGAARLLADRPLVAGLAPLASLDGEQASGDLVVAEVLGVQPAAGDPVPLATAIGLGLCVAFTILAGVTPWVIDYARRATLLF